VITSDSSAPGPSPSKLSADSVVAELAPGGVLSTLSGTGHTTFDQRTAAGVHQSSSSDQLDVHFVAGTTQGGASAPGKSPSRNAEIASITQTGHVVLMQDAPPARPGTNGKATTSGTVRATADRSDYDGDTELLRLTGSAGAGSPRVRDGALDLTATVIDFARGSGDAFAHGDVKASWTSSPGTGTALPGASLLGGGMTASGGGGGPIHAVAAEAELHQASQEVIFRAGSGETLNGSATALPRLWQGANSIIAPLITLNRLKQTLTAQAGGAATPVRTVLVTTQSAKSNARPRSSSNSAGKAPGKDAASGSTPSVIRLRSGDLHYSEGERLATLRAGAVGSVTAETSGPNGPTTVVSQEADVRLLPAGVRAASKTSSPSTSSASPMGSAVDQLIARGHVTVDWPDRKGSGEKLVYQSEDGTYTLTGTGAVPPRITDQVRGTVTGSALIFHSRDDSVTVEGNGRKTVTETQSPK
jgi:lipopolysaccharide export system protein LptA